MYDDESIFFLIDDNKTLYKEAIDDLFGAHITGAELEILATYLAKLRKEK
tara:strand:+ start:849 stop:998 length:150 start_codon:yes stop_codon:yes gene_type:complete